MARDDDHSEELKSFLSEGFATINLDAFTVNLAVARLIPRVMAERLRALPVNRLDSKLTVALEDPCDVAAAEEISRTTGLSVSVVRALPDALARAIARYY